MPSVFISYSRRDRDFVARLNDALAARDYELWVDWEDIPPSAEWFGEIRAGIDGADGFVYVISPDSAESKVCAQELEHATSQHKRVVPLVRRDPDGAHVPDAAAALNWIFLREGDDFDAGVAQLMEALELDLDHVRTHTRLGVEANRWETSGREGSQLLRGVELSAAEAWLVAGADKEPEATQLQREYVLAGRRAASRRQRTVIGAVTVALVVAAALAVVALIQRSTAIHERNVAFARQLDAEAQSQYPTDPELSVLLAVQAAHVNPGSATEEALRAALAQSHIRIRYTLAQAEAGDGLWNPAGTRLLVTSPGAGGWSRIYTQEGDDPPVALGSVPTGAGESAWDARGDRVVIGGSHAAVYDSATGKLLRRIPGSALFTALTPDGRRVVTVDARSVGHVFDVASGRQLASFHPRYRGGTSCFALSPDASVVAQCDLQSLSSNTSPAALDTWSARTGALLHSIHSPSVIGSVAFSPDSRRYVFTTPTPLPSTAHLSVSALARAEGRDGTFIHDTASGRRVIAFPESASAAAFSPSEQVPEVAYATVGDDLGHVYSFASHLNHALTGATDTINALRFDQGGASVVTASNDKLARVYNASTGGLPVEVLAGSGSPVVSAGFGRDDTRVATTSLDGTVRVWAGPTPLPSATLAHTELSPAADAFTTAIGFTSDSGRIVQTSQTGQGQVLDAHSLKVLARFRAPVGQGFAGAQATRDGRTIVALFGPLAHNFAIRSGVGAEVYDAASGRLEATITPTGEGGVVNAALDNPGDKLVTLGANGSADEWDTRTGKLLHHLPGTTPAGAAAFSADGSRLAIVHRPNLPPTVATTFGPITIDLWNADTGAHERTIVGDPLTSQTEGGRLFAPLTVAFSPDGTLLAVSGADEGVEVYHPDTGRLAHEALGIAGAPGGSFVESLGFSPNGKYLAAGASSGAYVWRIPSYTHLSTFQHVPAGAVSSLYVGPGLGVQIGFSADSDYLVTAGQQVLNAWDIADQLHLFRSDQVTRGAISPDASQIVAAPGAGVALYPCDLCGGLNHLLAIARRDTTTQLTPSERATYLKQG